MVNLLLGHCLLGEAGGRHSGRQAPSVGHALAKCASVSREDFLGLLAALVGDVVLDDLAAGFTQARAAQVEACAIAIDSRLCQRNCRCTICQWEVMGFGWDGMGWVGMGWDGMGWDGMGWDRAGQGWMGLE